MQTTAPTLADALEALARSEMDEGAPVPAITRALETLTPHLTAYRRDLWWDELKRCLDKRQQAGDYGPAWDEAGIDWGERVKEAIDVLTGTDQ